MTFVQWLAAYATLHKLDLNATVAAKGCTLQVGNVLNAFANYAAEAKANEENIKKMLTLGVMAGNPMITIQIAAKDLDYTWKRGDWTNRISVAQC
jgi:hypothetical protein